MVPKVVGVRAEAPPRGAVGALLAHERPVKLPRATPKAKPPKAKKPRNKNKGMEKTITKKTVGQKSHKRSKRKSKQSPTDAL